jgi:predicted amidohydrolase
MPTATYHIAGAQLAFTDTLAGNVAKVVSAIQRAGSEGADFLVVPEMMLTGYHNKWSQEDAEEGYTAVSAACREARVCGLIGAGEWQDGVCTNQVRVYGADGEYLGAHAKTLLTTADAEQFGPGGPLRTWEVKGLRFGCLICNDFWCNPTGTDILDMKLALQLGMLGAKVIFHAVASGHDKLYTEFHVGNLRARARAAGVFVATANAAQEEGVNCPSGIMGSDGQWVCATPVEGEQFYCHEITP